VFKLTYRNALRHPLRSGLTITGLAVAVLAFCLLRTVVAAWYAGVDTASPVRLITRNAISLTFRLPMAYYPRIQAIPGVKQVSYGNWVGGTYIDDRNFFPQISVHLPSHFDVYPEFVIDPGQMSALLQDRRGCVAGRKLVERYGWRLGDAITIKGTVFPSEFELIVRAIYRSADPGVDEGRLYFHFDYLNETAKRLDPDRADQVGWFAVQVHRPELVGPVAQRIDDLFANSLAETKTESEAVFILGMIAMSEAILLAIQVVSWLVIGVILMVLSNTMAMSARERLPEYAVLKTMGFGPRHLAGIILGESMLLALMGGLIGLALTFPAVQIFKTSLGQYFRVFPLTNLTLALGIGTALAVGLLAAIIPAWQASRVGIAEALRKVG
jgi:putative ABC transport system permease protein